MHSTFIEEQQDTQKMVQFPGEKAEPKKLSGSFVEDNTHNHNVYMENMLSVER